jgi:hypothetical protein
MKGLLLLIVISVFVHATCTKRIDCTKSYSFELGIKAIPNQEIVNIGDTIWFSINDSNYLKDLFTAEIVNYRSAANLSVPIGFLEVLAADNHVEAANRFEYIIRKGSLVSNYRPNLIREIAFIESNNRYQIEVGVIPKTSGTFRVIFSNAANVYTNSDGCQKSKFNFVFKDTDQHFGLGFNVIGPGNYYFKVQ